MAGIGSAAVAVGLALTAAGCGGGGGARTAAATATVAPATTVVPVSTTVAPASTTVAPPTTAVPPSTTLPEAVDAAGSLPQTHVLPTSTDPQFLARMGALCSAIGAGNPGLAQDAFFPLGAYVQVKGISDPVHDYQTRLIADYDQDIDYLHAYVTSAAEPGALSYVHVPDAAEWILPGVEYNKGSYYRVYGTVLGCTIGGQQHTFDVASLISWRGEWYVVHLRSIR